MALLQGKEKEANKLEKRKQQQGQVAIDELIENWVKNKAGNIGIEFIDLEYKKGSKRKFQDEYKVHPKIDIKPGRLVYAQQPHLLDQERKQLDVHVDVQKNQGTSPMQMKFTYTDSVQREETFSLSLGITLGASLQAVGPGISGGFSAEMSLLATGSQTHTKQTTATRECQFDVAGNSSETVMFVLYSVPTVTEITLDLNLSGDVPVCLKEKVKFNNNTKCFEKDNSGKKLHFIPVKDIFMDLQGSSQLPADFISCEADEKTVAVTCRLRGDYRVEKYSVEAIRQAPVLQTPVAQEQSTKPIISQTTSQVTENQALITQTRPITLGGKVGAIGVDIEIPPEDVRELSDFQFKELMGLFAQAAVNGKIRPEMLTTVMESFKGLLEKAPDPSENKDREIIFNPQMQLTGTKISAASLRAMKWVTKFRPFCWVK